MVTDESNGNPQLKRRESIGLFRIPCAGEESDDSLNETLSCTRRHQQAMAISLLPKMQEDGSDVFNQQRRLMRKGRQLLIKPVESKTPMPINNTE